LQEQIDRESIAITVKASKLTAQGLALLLKPVVNQITKKYKEIQMPHGKQSVKQLMSHSASTNTIPIEGDMGLFEKVAKKWHVDYAFHKTGEDKYLLLFKSNQADAMTAAFSEYSKLVMKQAKDKRPPIKAQLEKATQKVEREKLQREKQRGRTHARHRQRNRANDVSRE